MSARFGPVRRPVRPFSAFTPPLFGHAPGLVCGRWMTDHTCGSPGDTHVMWTDDGDNGIVCTEHAKELGTTWAYLDLHSYNPECSIGGALWQWGNPSRCVHDDIPVAETESVLAPYDVKFITR